MCADTPAPSPTDHALAAAMATTDVLRRVAGTTALHLYELRYAADGSYECTAFVGEGLESLLGPLPEGLDEEQAWELAVHPDDRERYGEFSAACQRAEPSEVEYRLVGYDGVTRWVWERARPRVEHGVVYVDGIVADVSERHRAAEELAAAQARLEHLAYHDSLTGLPNRLRFHECLELAVSGSDKGHGIAVLFVDLDDFKLVNDGFGHAVGDQLLVHAAERLRAACRREDVVARQGGDEFLILVHGNGSSDSAAEAAEAVAMTVRETLGQPFQVADASVYVTPSIGVSLYPRDGDTAEMLLKHADIALYAAKDAGRDNHRYYRRPQRDSGEELAVASQLRDAVRRDELTLHYQPLVDLGESCILGAEALIRWNHPERGLLAPASFLPAAERSGLIRDITTWVIERACIQARRWCDRDLDLYVSVNLPPSSWHPLAIRRMLATIDAFGIAADRLMIEVTEHAAMGEAAELDATLAAIHSSGLRLAIDDFGTGYSSLGRLRRLRPTVLKIDRSFVADLPGDRDAAVLVQTMITMAKKLDITCLAEGIETEQQLAFLRTNGCPLGQGYLYSRPLPAAQFDALMGGNAQAA
jgi:diguanylate cyclase (GGDEF)-like protein/PAS domain S-box-containing protein